MSTVITTQPGAYVKIPGQEFKLGWMKYPGKSEDHEVPFGLEYLQLLDNIQIKQQIQLKEVLFSCPTQKTYVILNRSGQQVYYAHEESLCCARYCTKSYRGFTLHIVDNFNKEVMRITRPHQACAGCICSLLAVPGSCCSYEITVEAPPGHVIGTVRQRRTKCMPGFYVNDEYEKPKLKIGTRDCCRIGKGEESDEFFEVESIGGEEMGNIRKRWTTFSQEVFTSARSFDVNFPTNLNVKSKATLIGAAFLIDYIHYQK